MRWLGSVSIAIFLLACADVAPAASQAERVADPLPLVGIGSPAEDRLRLGELLGEARPARFFFRTASDLSPELPDTAGFVIAPLMPEGRFIHNSALPYSLNEGALWAGRGSSFAVQAGVRARYGPLSLTLAPSLTRSQNRPFETLPDRYWKRRPQFSRFSSIWHRVGASIDFPWRFGEQPYTRIAPGQSSVQLESRRLALGISTENQWWGPGRQNALLLSNNAPGFPHFFLRTNEPWRTRIGVFEGRWVVGGLTESLFFDSDTDNDLRSLSALGIAFSPAFEPQLTVGVTRSVYGQADNTLDVLTDLPNVLLRWEHPRAVEDTLFAPRFEQIIGLFGRWAFPEAGFEGYVEWARHELPSSLRDLAVSPHHTQGLTFGLQWARPLSAGVLRLHAEATTLELSSTFKQRPMNTFYTSRSVPQGYTHRGRVLGAAIGPGSSSQWLGAQFLMSRSTVGLSVGRVRWETDAVSSASFPAASVPRGLHSNDTSILVGLDASIAVAGFDVELGYLRGNRLNYLFQNPNVGFGGIGAVDIVNHTFRLGVTPRL